MDTYWRQGLDVNPLLSRVKTSRVHVFDLFQFPAELLGNPELAVYAPVDLTGSLACQTSVENCMHMEVHPYLIKSGVYALTDNQGSVIYIGQTSAEFGVYIRNKLGMESVSDHQIEGTIIKCTARYWMDNVSLLDASNERVRNALVQLLNGEFRVYLLPVELRNATSKEAYQRALRSLEKNLLTRCEQLTGYRPPLNYSGSNSPSANSVAHGHRVPKKVRRFLQSRRWKERGTHKDVPTGTPPAM